MSYRKQKSAEKGGKEGVKPGRKGRKEGGRESDESLYFPLMSHTYFDFRALLDYLERC